MLKPSDFKVQPWNSATGTCESEIIARNIMVILSKTGDEWRELTWEEYKEQRLKDGNFSSVEGGLFDKVVRFCKSADTAVLFSKTWDDIAKSKETKQ